MKCVGVIPEQAAHELVRRSQRKLKSRRRCYAHFMKAPKVGVLLWIRPVVPAGSGPGDPWRGGCIVEIVRAGVESKDRIHVNHRVHFNRCNRNGERNNREGKQAHDYWEDTQEARQFEAIGRCLGVDENFSCFYIESGQRRITAGILTPSAMTCKLRALSCVPIAFRAASATSKRYGEENYSS